MRIKVVTAKAMLIRSRTMRSPPLFVFVSYTLVSSNSMLPRLTRGRAEERNRAGRGGGGREREYESECVCVCVCVCVRERGRRVGTEIREGERESVNHRCGYLGEKKETRERG
jgi:hypothetical protein